MIEIYVGSTGQGKTYLCAMTILELLKRNVEWFEKRKTTERRRIATNITINRQLYDSFKEYFVYWTDMEQLVNLRECDIVFDDMGAYLDAQRWNDLPMSVKRWLRLHEHYGCDIYGNAQDFLSIDISIRRLTGNVFHVNKTIGSPRPSATKPKVKRVWGLLVVRRVAEELLDKEKMKYEYQGFPHFYLLKRKYCNVFDTSEDLKQSEYPPLHHIERLCPDCGKAVIKHA